MNCVELKGSLFADRQEWHFHQRTVYIRAVPSCKRVDVLMLTNIGFRVRKVQMDVLSSNEIELLMLKNRVFRVRNEQKCAVHS